MNESTVAQCTNQLGEASRHMAGRFTFLRI
jgi:hypothetical protein